jgi:hypothetical protein
MFTLGPNDRFLIDRFSKEAFKTASNQVGAGVMQVTSRARRRDEEKRPLGNKSVAEESASQFASPVKLCHYFIPRN